MSLYQRARSAARILLKGEQSRKLRTSIPEITPEEIAQIKQYFPREKFFILGHARSGTTLLMRLVRLHPDVYCNYQAHFFTRRPLLRSLVDTVEAEEWLSRKSNRWNHGRDLSPLVLRAAADFIMERDAQPTGKKIVGDKSPTSNIHGQAIRDLHAVYPDAKLIYIVRDGRDVAVSERFRNFVEESKFLNREDRKIIADLRKDNGLFGDGRQSIFTDKYLNRVSRAWALDLSEIESEGRRLYRENLHTLRFEDLVSAPLNELNRVWSFLGASAGADNIQDEVELELKSNPDEEWQSRRNGDLAAFLPKGQTGNWKNLFTSEDKQLFKKSAGELLIRWRYEQDGNW